MYTPTLSHHGVKGMKWGVRRRSSSGPSPVTVRALPGKRVLVKGGSGHSPSEDAVRTAVLGQKARSSTSHSLSNKELQDLVQRMNLEQQYSNLSSRQNVSTVRKGGKVVKDILSVGTTVNQAVSLVNSPAGQILKEQLAKKK